MFDPYMPFNVLVLPESLLAYRTVGFVLPFLVDEPHVVPLVLQRAEPGVADEALEHGTVPLVHDPVVLLERGLDVERLRAQRAGNRFGCFVYLEC